jgi:hypothetical protein
VAGGETLRRLQSPTTGSRLAFLFPKPIEDRKTGGFQGTFEGSNGDPFHVHDVRVVAPSVAHIGDVAQLSTKIVCTSNSVSKIQQAPLPLPLARSARVSCGWSLPRRPPTISMRTPSSPPPPFSRPWPQSITPTSPSPLLAIVSGVFAPPSPPDCNPTPQSLYPLLVYSRHNVVLPSVIIQGLLKRLCSNLSLSCQHSGNPLTQPNAFPRATR